MFDDILEKIKGIATNTVSAHSEVSAEHSEGIANEAMESISEELKKIVSGGNFAGLSGLISGEEAPENNSNVQNIIHSFAGKLTQRFGLAEDKATALSSDLIPAIFHKVKDEFGDGKFDFKSLLSQLSLTDMMKLMSSAGGAGGLLGKVKGLFGK